ncbi:beta-galactosidase, partial [Candidatus Sumerlaeota bacterium]|nr:beta-galactosidase [Candidatus Sumerlaeota bacterium]
NPCWKNENGAYIDKASLIKERRNAKDRRMLLDLETDIDFSQWIRDTDNLENPSAPTIEEGGAGGSSKCLKMFYANFTNWDTLGIPMKRPFPEGYGLTCFFAKGEEQTTMLSLEWEERDRSRWIASIKITPEWQFFVLVPEDFKYWHRSATGGNRGFMGDKFNPQNAVRFRFGLAMSHTFIPRGEHAFWMDEISVAPDILGGRYEEFSGPVLETISPAYKFYPVKEIHSVECAPLLGETPPALKINLSGFSPTWRPQGTGYDKNRKRRFIPLIKTFDKNGLWNGTLASLLVHTDGKYRNSCFATITFDSPEIYKRKEALELIAGVCGILKRGIFLTEGGSEYFAYFHDDREARLGARVLNISGETQDLKIDFSIKAKDTGKIAYHETRGSWFAPNQQNNSKVTWKPESFEKDAYIVSVKLTQGGKVIDALEHELNIWFPPENRDFIRAREGHFYSDLKKEVWMPFGVNYMPSTGIAFEENESFEHWFDPHAYDPEIIETDLARVEKVLKMNMVSVFLYSGRTYSGNLLDILCRCRRHNLKVHFSLRPWADPLQFNLDSVAETINQYRLAENDTIFAYDIAWEPWFGPYEKRKMWDEEWKNWIETHYGSIENAEKDWGIDAERDAEGNVTSPSNEQISKDGKWRVMVAAYRRFVDDFICKKYSYAIRKIKEIDPNHLVSFRMSEAGNPTCGQEHYPYDVRAIVKPVDFFEPEGYGRFSSEWDGTRNGIFTAFYLRSLGKKPVFWGEFGQNVWAGSNFSPDERLRDMERKGYHNFLRMILDSRSDGGSAWWYPGGFRWNENSDYGLLNPDGSERPLMEAIEKYHELIKNPAWLKDKPDFIPDAWLIVDRDKNVDGICGIYRETETEFWKLQEAGKTIGFKTEGTGSSSVDVSLIAIGNVPFTGFNPPKYLNSVFNYVKFKNREGEWIEAGNSGEVIVEKDKPVALSVSVSNIGDAAWIGSLSLRDNQKGGVYLNATDESDIIFQIPIPGDVPFFGDVILEETICKEGIRDKSRIVLRLYAKDRAWFGEKMEFTLIPE